MEKKCNTHKEFILLTDYNVIYCQITIYRRKKIFSITSLLMYQYVQPSKHEVLAQCWADVGPAS